MMLAERIVPRRIQSKNIVVQASQALIGGQDASNGDYFVCEFKQDLVAADFS